MAENPAYEFNYRDELINGKIVLMSPRPSINHNRISGNIYRIFADYLDGKPCEAFGDGVDLYLSEKDRFVPDGMIICDKNIILDDGVHGTPDLVVEILSPSTALNDRQHKLLAYESAGVKEYWIVSPESKSVEVYLLANGKLTLNEIYTVYPDFMLKNMSETELLNMKTDFKTSLYENLIISVKQIFHGVV